ncbi:MAG TPA: molybdopterin cofactor-binding domain-containing protein [Gaiellaceae bacterium]|jgi:CO/xanthine dehydrogenase Mo-binding subunit|nr:molybdopterin cofactor-binding domain-containing protein [Gaiellaceae bacterium]
MTGLMHEKSFSRTSFLKGGGALVVGFSLAGTALAGRAAAAAPTAAGYLPDVNQVDSWITIGADNTVTLKTSQIEVGNGITTGFLQVLAEELDMDMSQMYYGHFNNGSAPHADTYVAVSTGGEGGSNAMSGTGPKIRNVGALARKALLGLASTNLGVPVANLSVDKGVVSGGGKTVTYGALVGGKLLKITGANVSLQPGVSPAKPFSAYKTVLKDPNPVVRIDIPAKVDGSYAYVQSVRVPGMLHGRMVRPRGQGAYPYNSNVPASVDPSSIAHIPNAKVVRVNNFLGVVAPKEYDAIQAAAQLKVVWNTNPILPGTGNLWTHYRQLDSAGKIPARYSTTKGNVETALASAAHTVSGSFAYHYQGHMPIGPSCCVADVTATNATLWSNTQNVESLVTDLVNVLSPLKANQIRVIFYEGAGSFGNGCVAFDTAESAAIMSKAVGAPVRLQMMRWDEHGWTHFGPAILYDMRAGVDTKGNMVAYDATGFGQGGTSLYTGRELLGAGPGAPSAAVNSVPTIVPGSGTVSENLSPWMNVANTNYRLLNKPIDSTMGIFQSGPLRAPGAPQTTFADAQTVDMLAVAANMDPLAFRLQNIQPDSTNQRWAAVLQAAATAANWKPFVPGSNLSKENIVTGRGIANSHHGGAYAAVVADIKVNKKSGKITVTHLYGAQDSGFAVNPDLVYNQMVGNLIQGTSRALSEEVTFNKNQVTSIDWVTYPILRFTDAPAITHVLVQRTDQPSLGSGEPVTCPVIGAVANAFFDATGVRMHEAPLTSGRVRAQLRAAGVS